MGQLTIFSANDGMSSFLNTSGHAWIAFKNTYYQTIRIGGITVSPYGMATVGTFGNIEAHLGIWYNIESYYMNLYEDYDPYPNRVSITIPVTQSQIDTINDIISNNDAWTATNNCSSFATKVWNAVSSTDLSAGFPNTPTSLRQSIIATGAYETEKPISSHSAVGYVSGGIFHSYFSRSTRNISGFTDLPVVFMGNLPDDLNSNGIAS